jgi:chromosome segregation ATPase
MFDTQEKYVDQENPEDVLQAALTDPEGSYQILERISALNWEILELEKRWDALNSREEKATEKVEKLRSRAESEEQQRKLAEAEDDADDAKAEREALEKSLEASRRKREVEQRTYDDLADRLEKVGNQIDELKAFFQERLLFKPLEKKVNDWVKPMDKQELHNLHFETLKRDKSAPSRRIVLEGITNELNRRDNIDAIKKRDRQEKENEGGLPGPTRRTEREEEELIAFYLKTRRAAQAMEGAELRSLWAKGSDIVEGAEASLRDFLFYKAHANEFMARYRIADRGSLEPEDN